MKSNCTKKLMTGMAAILFAGVLSAQTVVVSEADVTRQVENTPPTDNWVLFTRVGTPPSAGVFMNGPGNPPLGCGSIQLTTNLNSEKVFLFNYDHVNKPIGSISNVSYWAYRSATAGAANVALNVQIDFNGSAPGGFSTLVYEPYLNGTVIDNTWQFWDAKAGLWWSTRPIGGHPGGQGPLISWAQVVQLNPDAVILAVGLNQGSFNAGTISAADAFKFDQATYNFEGSVDSDGDGMGDGCDTDDDNDGVPDEYDCDPLDSKKNKWLVCHNGNTICVSQSAVAAHQAHGDQLGACQTNRGGVTEITEIGENFKITVAPNPVISTATIKYELAVDAKVSIVLFDPQGKALNTLVNADRKAGVYNYQLDASKLPAGIYYYRMTAIAGDQQFVQGQKLMIVK